MLERISAYKYYFYAFNEEIIGANQTLPWLQYARVRLTSRATTHYFNRWGGDHGEKGEGWGEEIRVAWTDLA